MRETKYLDADQIIEINRTVLREIKVKKADRHGVADRRKIEAIVREVESLDGDIYEKAACLMSQIVSMDKGHAFDSGNRRTAYAATKLFLKVNGVEWELKSSPRIFTGIREGFYSTEEVVALLKGKAIREFTRF